MGPWGILVSSKSRVAVLGGGPGGIVTAKFLRDHGFEPVIFERSYQLGGQWHAEGTQSGVWPSMRTNTSAIMTCFSDMPHEQVSLFPHHRQMFAYLQRYSAEFEVTSSARLNCSVKSVTAESGGCYRVSWQEGGTEHDELFDRVVVATGRYQNPSIPEVEGLGSFNGPCGISHSFEYKHPEKFWKKRVLVAGCAISALEIASDLVLSGTEEVVTCSRRQRYVLPKLVAGVPTDQLLFSRFAAQATEVLPPGISKANLQQMIVQLAGNPARYGARPADPDVFSAGISLCQTFLPLVAEGRITTKPWIEEVNGNRVTFEDGTRGEFDGIIFGTGYKPAVPFLTGKIADAVNSESIGLSTSNLTFHPEAPNMAFVGMFGQVGPYFPVLELQARYVAAVWSGQIPAPTTPPRSRPDYPTTGDHIMHLSAIRVSRAIGAEPDVTQFPEIAGALMFGPLPAISFRLSGRDALPGAAATLADAVAENFPLRINEEQAAKLSALQKAAERSAGAARP